MARLTAVLAGLLMVGCQAASLTTPSPSPTVTSAPTTPPLPSPSPTSDLGCQTFNAVIRLPTPTIDNLAQQSTAVAAAFFVRFGESYWNTPGGVPPNLETVRQGRAEIRTPLVLAPNRFLRGNESSVMHVVLAHEGRIGCVRFSGYITPLFAVAGRYVFFLYSSLDSTGAADDDLPVVAAWPVDDDDTVHTALDGDVPLGEVQDRLAAGASAMP